MKRIVIPTATIIIAALLTSCTATASAGSAQTKAPKPTPTPTASAAATEVADSCAQIDTTEPTTDGTLLGTCISDMLRIVNTMKAHSESEQMVQDAVIRIGSDRAIDSTTVQDGMKTRVVFVDEVAYRDEGDGWKKGVMGSDDPDEVVIAGAGQALVALFTPESIRQYIGTCPVWNIDVGTTKLTLPDDKVIDARAFTCAAPFEVLGVTANPVTVWMGHDWIPYGSKSTATAYGYVVTDTVYYYDHGVAVNIVAPM